MMWAGQPGHDELETRRARLDPQTRGERGMNCAATRAAGELRPDLPGWTEQLAIAMAAAGNAHDIRIDQSDRIAVEADSRERRHVRRAQLLIVLAASFCLALAGLLGAYHFLRPDSVSSPPPVQSPNAPAGISNSSEGHRLETNPTIVRATDRAAAASAPAGPNVLSSTRTAHSTPSSVVPPAPSARNLVTPPPSPAASAAKPQTEARLTPVPETRPTTIDGWVLREVVNGTAVLEGPDGIVRVKRGDTVPGLGRVVAIFGWGKRLIVATTKGLISTP
jgi:hypothetical protein